MPRSGGLNAVPLENAFQCAECEVVSESRRTSPWCSVMGTRLRRNALGGQPITEYNHRYCWMRKMLLNWDSGNVRQIRIHAILAVAGLFAVLVARNVPPDFPSLGTLQQSSVNTLSTISAVSSHDQRPRFDCNGLHWTVPTRQYLPFPPTAKTSHLNSPSEIFPAVSIKGDHYNRPPPVA